MKIMSIYSTRNALNFTLFEMENEAVIVSGSFERIGLDVSSYKMKYGNEIITEEIECNNHVDVVKILLDKLVVLNIINDYDDIKGIGHRILHGAEVYKDDIIISNKVLNDLKDNEIINIHSLGAIRAIEAFLTVLPNVFMVGVFDTAFHNTIDEETYLYPIPYKWYTDYGVRKYGFQGISHSIVSQMLKEVLGKENYKAISCHLGDSSSICAIKDMKCVDTSMGFTPLAGIMMATRSGDIDPSIIPYIMEKEGKNASEVVDDLYKHSGLLGLSEYSDDILDILSYCDEGDKKAILTKNKYVRKIVDYIAEYYVLLGGVDAIVFTAGIGVNNVSIRREICEKLNCLGVRIDLDLNNTQGELIKISTNDSSIDIYVIPTNEELMIARSTMKLMIR